MSKKEPNMQEELIRELFQVWKDDPSLRFAQLLTNVIEPEDSCPEIYHIEDSELLSRLKKYHQKIQKENFKKFINSMKI